MGSNFLGEADFDGQPIDPPSDDDPVTDGGEATYNGFLTFTNIDRNMVEQLLLPGFQLAPRKTTHTPNVHPVILLFGDQTDGASVLAGTLWPSGIHYSEKIFAVPFVQKSGENGWHTFIIRMYLDNDFAIAGGLVFGYRKRKAWIDWKGDDVRIRDVFLNDLLEGCFSWGATWHDGNDALASIPNFSDMVSIMSTRLLGHNFNVPICSHWEWNLDKAKVATAETSYNMIAPFTSSMNAWPALSPFNNVTDGAVVVRGLRWRLSRFPIPC